MKSKQDQYAVLDKEVMPWGSYAGTRISKVPIEYCKKTLREPGQLNPYLRKLLKLRIEKEKNWLKDLQNDLKHFRQLAERYERELQRANSEIAQIREVQMSELRAMIEPVIRQLRRVFATKYHPDTVAGSVETMAMVNEIFNALDNALRDTDLLDLGDED